VAGVRRRPPIPYDPRPFTQKLGIAFQSRVPLLIGGLALLAIPALVAVQLASEGELAAAGWTLVPMAAIVAAWRLRNAFKILGWLIVAATALAFLRDARIYHGAFGLIPPRAATATADAHGIAVGTLSFAALCMVAGAVAWAVRAARSRAPREMERPLRVLLAGAGELGAAEAVVAAACGVLASLLLSPAATPSGLLGTAVAAAIGAYVAARFGAVGACAFAGGLGFVSVFSAAMFDVRSPLNTLAAPVLLVAASAALLAWFDMGFIALTYVGRQRRFEVEQADRAAATGIVPE